MTRFLNPLMSRILAAAIALACARPAIAETPPAVRQIRVDIDFARIIRLPEGAQTLVLGNPLIADAALLRGDSLVVITGKSFGSTNLLMLDADGARIAEAILTVTPVNSGLVVFRGPDARESFACDPDCVRSVTLGDDSKSLGDAVKDTLTFTTATSAVEALKKSRR
jgi:Flp pilus assembly secretin CpaC